MKKITGSTGDNFKSYHKQKRSLLQRFHQISTACLLSMCFVTGAVSAHAANSNNKGQDLRLFKAVSSCEPERVKTLIKEGADVNAKDNDGWTPLHKAAYRNGAEKIAEMLIKAGADLNTKNNLCIPLSANKIQQQPKCSLKLVLTPTLRTSGAIHH